jgi:protein CpxP
MGGVLGPMMVQRLELTPDQKDRLKSIVSVHQDERKALGERAMAARQALEAAVAGDTFDEPTVRMRSAELAVVEVDVAVSRARIYNEVFQMLTPAQQSKLKDMQSAMRAREHDHRQDRRGPTGR